MFHFLCYFCIMKRTAVLSFIISVALGIAVGVYDMFNPIVLDENGDWGKGSAAEYPDKLTFVAGTPFCHAPCMVRAEAYRAANGYSEDKKTLRAEDYDLWFRLYSMGYKGYNIQEPLYKMRDDENAYQRRKFKYALNEAYVRRKGYKLLGLPLKYRVYSMRPVVVALLPKPLYKKLHQKKKEG